MNVLRLFTALVFLTGMFSGLPALAAEYSFRPAQDTCVYSWGGDTVYGLTDGIATGTDGGSQVWYAYLMFDLTSIPANEVITGAVLHQYQFLGLSSGYGTNLYRIADIGWSEADMTWSTRPAEPGGTVQLGYNPNGGTYGGWSTWDLFGTAEWAPAADQAAGWLSLKLTETRTDGTQTHNWYSREHADANFRPYLEITTAPVPIPGALWLLGSGLLGLVALRRRMKR